MRESTIILPRVDNDGRPLNDELDAALSAFIEAFDGATIQEANGCWNGPNGRQCEPIIRVHVAHSDSYKARQKLRTLAIRAWRSMRQLSGYLKHGNGEVEIIDVAGEGKEAA